MKKLILLLLLLSFMPAFSFDMSMIRGKDFDTFDCSQFDAEIVPHCENTKNFIRTCYQNPNNCDCSQFSEPEARDECEKWVSDGIKLMNEKSQECMNDIYSCSCDTLPHPRLVSACEKERSNYLGKLRAMEQNCFNDPASCDCSVFESEQYISKCEEELGKASQIAQSCIEDIKNCDCSGITNQVGRAKCEENKAFYQDYENNFRNECEENFDNCDCSKIPNLSGQRNCEEQKALAVSQAEGTVYAMLYDCFKDINACDCTKLEDEGYINYCEETKSYGFACMQTGGMGCEQLDNLVLYPPGLPAFLRPYFSRTFKAFIEDEKLKGMAASAESAKNCVIDPENCNCDNIPTYAREFCLDKKNMQLTCINGNITACEILDQTIEVVPRTAPEFVRNFLDPLLRPLMLLQKEQIKGRYAEQVKDQMLLCINDETECDCSSVPQQYINFCTTKIELVKACVQKDYESCFKLMNESNIPDDLPGFIRVFVEPSVNNQVKQRMNEVFLQVRPSVCADKDLDSCMKYYNDNCRGQSVNACLNR